jgi:alcohol dehydrogenase (cytochrome c)
MRKMMRARAALLLLLASAALLSEACARSAPAAPAPTVIDVTPEMLQAAPVADNWPSYNGDYTGQRHSQLAQITTANVDRLTAQWIFHTPASDRLEGTPVVINGVMLMTAANDAYALDARTGRTIWHYTRPVTEGLIDDASSHHNRGVAVWKNRVYMETDNAHLLCLDARSGHLIWDVEYANTKTENYGATSAPLVVKDLVLVGTSGGDDGVRGFLAAYDAQTGALRWKLWTIPGPGEAGSESWPGDTYLRGGGTTWMPGTYDPALNTLYWGTGNAAPDFDGSVRPGDDLYTACVLAIDPDTGTLRWHFQFTPHDVYDYDGQETPVLIDTTYQGQPRKLLVQANRNGFLYILDRTNGQFLGATPFLDNINWAKGIDPKGRPIPSGIVPTPAGAKICPGYAGGTNWYAPTYNPQLGQFFFLSFTGCNIYYSAPQPQPFVFGQTFYATGTKRVPGETGRRILQSYDVNKNTFSWRYPQMPGNGSGGALSTAGGLVFFGDDSNAFEAVEASSGKPLWHFNTGQSINASPMTYAYAGRQYVAIAAGGNVITFALPAQP